ncbi:hypothetical protein QCD60_04675 [Pokkaliibacter sp. MBI-7]|uniref:hypothetical protein n=1 Tax=Pokkaliibacter sp. MBI-7 TaxID=3040600 RepID=UPI00244BA8F6|nr:hypothetical protein [Pokkaliibacter sp. MBI-7]MDH2431846.1 hypothetical protein [Pokkaliibacter sp. MBI-7]
MYGESPSIITMLLPVLVWPVLVALPIGILLWFWRPRWQPLAVSAGVMMGVVGLHSSFSLMPRQALDWLFWMSLLPVVVLLLRRLQPVVQTLAAIVMMAVVALSLWKRMPLQEVLSWLVLAGGLTLLLQLGWQKVAGLRWVELGLFLSGSLLAVSTALGGSVLVGQLIGALTAVLTSLCCIPILRGQRPQLSAEMTAVVVTFLCVLGAYAHLFVEVPALAITASLIMPLLAASQLRRPGVAVVVLAVGVAIVAWQVWPQEMAY